MGAVVERECGGAAWRRGCTVGGGMMSGLDVAWGSTSLLVSDDDMTELYDV